MLTYYLGDIHGRTLWKPLWASLPPNARLVILGDYFDSRDAIIPARQMANFEELLALRRQQPQRLTLLLGNHDYHYFSFASESYSGYQAGAASAIGLLLQQALQTADVQVAHAADGILATHAGVTQTWLMEWGGQPDDVATYLQELFTHKPHAFAFSPGPQADAYGNEPEQGPFWVRPQALANHAIPGWVQVVGHTQMQRVTQLNGHYFIDTLGHGKEYLIAQHGSITVHPLPE